MIWFYLLRCDLKKKQFFFFLMVLCQGSVSSLRQHDSRSASRAVILSLEQQRTVIQNCTYRRILETILKSDILIYLSMVTTVIKVIVFPAQTPQGLQREIREGVEMEGVLVRHGSQ